MVQLVHACIGGDLAPSLGGRKKFRRPKFLNDLLGKKFHFPFLSQTFLMTFFSHRPYLSDSPCLYCVWNVIWHIYDPFHNKIPWGHLFYSVRTFARIRVPHLKFWGTVPLKSPPMHACLHTHRLLQFAINWAPNGSAMLCATCSRYCSQADSPYSLIIMKSQLTWSVIYAGSRFCL